MILNTKIVILCIIGLSQSVSQEASVNIPQGRIIGVSHPYLLH